MHEVWGLDFQFSVEYPAHSTPFLPDLGAADTALTGQVVSFSGGVWSHVPPY